MIKTLSSRVVNGFKVVLATDEHFYYLGSRDLLTNDMNTDTYLDGYEAIEMFNLCLTDIVMYGCPFRMSINCFAPEWEV